MALAIKGKLLPGNPMIVPYKFLISAINWQAGFNHDGLHDFRLYIWLLNSLMPKLYEEKSWWCHNLKSLGKIQKHGANNEIQPSGICWKQEQVLQYEVILWDSLFNTDQFVKLQLQA